VVHEALGKSRVSYVVHKSLRINLSCRGKLKTKIQGGPEHEVGSEIKT